MKKITNMSSRHWTKKTRVRIWKARVQERNIPKNYSTTCRKKLLILSLNILKLQENKWKKLDNIATMNSHLIVNNFVSKVNKSLLKNIEMKFNPRDFHKWTHRENPWLETHQLKRGQKSLMVLMKNLIERQPLPRIKMKIKRIIMNKITICNLTRKNKFIKKKS